MAKRGRPPKQRNDPPPAHPSRKPPWQWAPASIRSELFIRLDRTDTKHHRRELLREVELRLYYANKLISVLTKSGVLAMPAEAVKGWNELFKAQARFWEAKARDDSETKPVNHERCQKIADHLRAASRLMWDYERDCMSSHELSSDPRMNMWEGMSELIKKRGERQNDKADEV